MSADKSEIDWGHPILTPEGIEIRVPNIFTHLKRMGLVERHESGLYQLLPIIYEFLEPDYAQLVGRVRRVLGRDLSGPAWLRCKCIACEEKKAAADKTSLPFHSSWDSTRADIIQAMQRAQMKTFSRRKEYNRESRN